MIKQRVSIRTVYPGDGQTSSGIFANAIRLASVTEMNPVITKLQSFEEFLISEKRIPRPDACININYSDSNSDKCVVVLYKSKCFGWIESEHKAAVLPIKKVMDLIYPEYGSRCREMKRAFQENVMGKKLYVKVI